VFLVPGVFSVPGFAVGVVGGVAEQGLGAVDPAGWSGPGDAVDHLEVPVALVDLVVVA
jgi:hypothetical protein